MDCEGVRVGFIRCSFGQEAMRSLKAHLLEWGWRGSHSCAIEGPVVATSSLKGQTVRHIQQGEKVESLPYSLRSRRGGGSRHLYHTQQTLQQSLML